MRARVRSSIPLALAFLVGAVAGALVVGTWGSRTEEARPGSTQSASTVIDGSEARPPPGSRTGPGGGAAITTSSGEGAPVLSGLGGSGTVRAGDEPLATGMATLIVTLRGATPEVADSAIAYVLPAGGPGVDNAWDVPYGDVGASIAVPAPATYDVGVSFDVGHADFSLVRDVHLEIGESRSVDVPVTGTVRRPIHMRLGPGSLDHVSPGAIVAVTWSRTGLGGRGFPGRGEAMDGRPNVTTRFDPRTGTDTAPLADDGPWHATAGFEGIPVGTGGPLEVVVVPRIARPGDTVELRIEPIASVRALAPRPEGGWPEGTGPIRLTWEGVGRAWSSEVSDLEDFPRGVGMAVAPGRGRFTWSGPGIRPGTSETAEARAEMGAGTTVEIRLEPDPGTVRPPSRFRVSLRQAVPLGDGEESSWIASLRTGTRGVMEPSAAVGFFTEEAMFEMEAAPSREELHFLVGRGAEVSEEATTRGPGDVEIRLRPAGWVVVLPGTLAAARGATGRQTLERVDGGLMPYAEEFEGSPTHAALLVPLAVGRVLGPFPEGLLRLRLRRGGIAVADLPVTVRAGAFEPLRLPR